jgi:hypothetical protein
MKIKDLISALQTYDPELYVYMGGYEGGLVDVVLEAGQQISDVVQNVNAKWYYGPHENRHSLDGAEVIAAKNKEVRRGIELGEGEREDQDD